MNFCKLFKKQSVLNVFSYTFSQIITVLAQLIQVPLFIHFWGLQKYGEWVVLVGLPQFFIFFDGGLTGAITTNIVSEAAIKNWSLARNYIQTLRMFSFFMGSIFLLLVLISCFLIDWVFLLKLHFFNSLTSNTIILLISCWCFVNWQYGSLDARLKASNQNPLSAFIIAFGRLLDLVFSCLVLLIGGGPVDIAISYLFSSLLSRMILTFAANKASVHELNNSGTFQKFLLMKNLKPGLGFFGISLSQTILLQGSVQFLNQIGSSKEVALFTIARTLSRFIFMIGFVINSSFRVQLTNMHANNKEINAAVLTLKMLLFSFLAGLIGYALYVFYGDSIVHQLSKSSDHFSKLHLALIGLPSFVGLLWYVQSCYFMATNNHSKFGLFYFFGSLISFPVFTIFFHFQDPVYRVGFLLLFPELFLLLVVNTCFFKNFILKRFFL